MVAFLVPIVLVMPLLYEETHCFNSIEDIDTAFAILERRGQELKLEVEAPEDERPCCGIWRMPTREHMKTVTRVGKRGNEYLDRKTTGTNIENRSESFSKLIERLGF